MDTDIGGIGNSYRGQEGYLKNIWVPLSGQIAQQRKVETIANNIANANTAGFKKDRLAFKEHLTALTKGADSIDLPRKEWSPEDFYRSQGSENAFVKVDGSYIDFEQGPMNPTGNPLDFGLNGKGFFEVLTPNGIRFMRKGNFSLNQNGEVVTSSGFKVLSALPAGGKDSATPNDSAIEDRVLKVPTNSSFSVSKEGDVFNSQGKVGKVSVVEFTDLQALRKEGHSLFINNAKNNVKRENIATTVNQGFVEGSNVNAIKEMSELISAHRHFENIQKAINTYDAMSKQAVNDIAQF
jgi:flagellar basal-body rod protein FlgG